MNVTVQPHRICVVIGLLMCNSTLRGPLSSLLPQQRSSAAGQLQLGGYPYFPAPIWIVTHEQN